MAKYKDLLLFKIISLVVIIQYSPMVAVSSQEQSVTLSFVGDINFDGPFRYEAKHGYCTYNQTFDLVTEFFKTSDLTIGNLEAPFVPKDMEKYETKKYKPRLKAEPNTVYSLKYAGFQLMSLSNNHLIDFKEKPIIYTINLLKKVGIKPYGYRLGSIKENRPQEPVIVKVKGIKIGFLGYCDIFKTRKKNTGFSYVCIQHEGNMAAGPAIYTDENATRDIKALKKIVDVVVVSMHWGQEYRTKPSESQLQHHVHLTSLGVDLIIGCHPHVLEGHSITRNTFTAFSLGNFMFGPHGFNPGKFYFGRDPPEKVYKQFMKYVKNHPNVEKTLHSRILTVRINKKGFVSAKYLPLKIGFDPNMPKLKCFRPQPVKQAQWINVCAKNDTQCLEI